MKRFSFLIFWLTVFVACVNKDVKKEAKINNLFYDKAFEFRDRKITDSAYLYFNKAKDLFLVRKDSLHAGKCLVNMGIIATDCGDFFGGEELALNAIQYFDKKVENQYFYIHSNFNNLGIACYELRDYTNAIKFYDFALKFAGDSSSKLLYLNNKAKSLEELGNYQDAIKIYKNVLAGITNRPVDYARTLANIAYCKWLQNPKYNPEPEMLEALAIRKREGDLLGQNYSYAKFADYYTDTDPNEAKNYAEKMYMVASELNSTGDKLEALAKLIRLTSIQKSRQYFVHYRKLNDSLQTARSAAKNQFALIRYETEKHKADKLKLQRDNTALFTAVLIAIIGTIFLIFWHKKRKQKIEAKAQSDIRESQLKTSKKVHDVVANGLYRVITELENREDFDKENILDKIDQLYNKSRDISYEIPAISEQPFYQKITELLSSFQKDDLKITSAGNNIDLWTNISLQIKYELEHILQELLVNMDKHSNATCVSLIFERNENQININYYDNGVGMPADLQFKNGLTNTENRINSIDGSVTFENKVEGGLSIQLSFPLLK